MTNTLSPTDPALHEHAHTQRITKAINRNVEMVSSARALKAGDTFSVKDIKVGTFMCIYVSVHVCGCNSYVVGCRRPLSGGLDSHNHHHHHTATDPTPIHPHTHTLHRQAIGKQLNRDIRREEVTRKKSRVEEKLAELAKTMEEAS